MPAKSKKQQRFMGMVYARKKGKLPNASKAVEDAAKSMTSSDVKAFASTKHKGLPEKVEEKEKAASVKLDKFLREVRAWQMPRGGVARAGDQSVLGDSVSRQAGIVKNGGIEQGVNVLKSEEEPILGSCSSGGAVLRPIDSTKIKAAGLVRQFFPMIPALKVGQKLIQKRAMVPQLAMSQSTEIPLADAKTAMQQFLPAARGKPRLAGLGAPPVGLPAGGVKAPAFPGAGNSPATNPIDTYGGLDPAGLTVDGNHAVGVAKGFKVAAWVRDRDGARGR